MKYIKESPHAWQNHVKEGIEISLWQQFSGALLLICFGGVFLHFLVPGVWSGMKAISWEATPCLIIDNNVKKHKRVEQSGIGREVTQFLVRYSYEVNGTKYYSNRYSFLNPSTSGSRADNIAVQYPLNSKATCYVDPNNSAQAVLNRTFTAFNLMICIPLVFFLLGLMSFFTFCKNCLKKIKDR